MKTRSMRKRQPSSKRSLRRPAARLGLLLAAAVAVSTLIASLAGGTQLAASSGSEQAQTAEKHYKATRAFVVDQQSGDVRLPTDQEVAQVVATLTSLGQRSAETLPQSSQASGTVTLDLEGGFAGVVLARPKGDGTWETKCVFTLEEGAEFLGLVQDDSAR